jgi:hypothetical protein
MHGPLSFGWNFWCKVKQGPAAGFADDEWDVSRSWNCPPRTLHFMEDSSQCSLLTAQCRIGEAALFRAHKGRRDPKFH